LKEVKEMVESNSKMYIFTHKKSGAELVFIRNSDKNKTLNIGIKTCPYDNKGIPHIIEHSVLGGSKNFPVKDPFFSVLNGQSLYTFMNAMTSSTFTSYPVSTRDEKDFNNLMYLYFDAVFNPLVIEEENIFLKEGIRKDLESVDGKMSYNGIVYNEMKGTTSNQNSALNDLVMKTLFPDSTYAYNSGGVPSAIESLKYDELKEFYKKYYHPSNSVICLYGDVDIMDRLNFIDEEYLSSYNRKKINADIGSLKGFSEQKEVTGKYAVSEEADLDNKTIIDISYAVSNNNNMLDGIGLDLIAEILNSPDSILKEELIKAGLSTNYNVGIDVLSKKNVLSFTMFGSDPSNKEKFKKVIENIITKMSKDGIDHKMAKSIINKYELSQKLDKISTRKGVNFTLGLISNWANDSDYLNYVEYNDVINKINSNIDNNFLEELVKKYLNQTIILLLLYLSLQIQCLMK
jgi:hypothetical protein